jgi:hypothetical protein
LVVSPTYKNKQMMERLAADIEKMDAKIDSN